jgi:3-methylornithine--L-lysine ligase
MEKSNRLNSILQGLEKGRSIRIAIAGGRLQAVEAVYLAKKAGWETLIIDKNPRAPAAGICDIFLPFTFNQADPVPPNCPPVDLILPAIEDTDALAAVKKWAEEKKISLAFDMNAYRITCSKSRSDALFEKLNLPTPGVWPECGFPVVVKPDQASGSQGVHVYQDAAAFHDRFCGRQTMDHMVIQQYLEGPSFSIEIVGNGTQFIPLCVTDLAMDAVHDCKRVMAPTCLNPCHVSRLEAMAITLAKKIQLNGIMDVEVILHKEELKLLEIDARFPSQTPMAVYWSTGINMVELLGRQFLGTLFSDLAAAVGQKKQVQWVVVEHIQVSETGVRVAGEHIMAQDGPLVLVPNFFGATEAITSYAPGKSRWVATMIFCEGSRRNLDASRKNCYKQIREHMNLTWKGRKK